jgi:hypothetical protein
MDEKLLIHNEKLIKLLLSPKVSKRYEACQSLRAAPEITPEALKALQNALNDPDLVVANEAKRALAIHLASDTFKDKENVAMKVVPSISSKVKTNKITIMLIITALIIYIGGFFIGLVLGNTGGEFSGLAIFSFNEALIYWFPAFIIGTVLLGFAEIINLIQKKDNK